MNIQEINFSVPIQESGRNSKNEFMIEGTAINATTTSNGHVFTAEELSKSAGSLKGRPLLKDHVASVDNIVGKIRESGFNEQGQKVDFKAIVIDKEMQDKIKSGLIDEVSVGASVEDIKMELDDEGEQTGNLVLQGITFKELSLVAVAADSGATFAKAIAESYDQRLQLSIKDKNLEEKSVKEAKKVDDLEKIKQEKATLEKELKSYREAKEKADFEKKVQEEVDKKVAKIKEELEKEPEAEAEEEAETEVEDKTKGDVKDEPEEEAEESTSYEIEESPLGGTALSANYNSCKNLKNLVRD